jgi:type I restriction enzyme, S subunit
VKAAKPLGEVCDIVGGGTPAKDNAEFYGGNIRWATVRDMRADVIADTEFKITPLAVENSSTNVISKGNVVIATRVGLGKVCLLQHDTAINQDLRAIIPKDSKEIFVLFLFWWLKSISYLIVAEGTGATVQGVKLPFIKSLPFPILEYSEQQRIVAVLDDAFAGIAAASANAEKNLRNARELFASYLNFIFTRKGESWLTCKLGDEVKFIDYRGKTPPKMETGIRLITAKNVKMNRIQRDPEEFIDARVYDDWMTRGYPRKGDVLFTTEAPLGNVAQLDTDETVVIGQRLITMQPNDVVLDRTFLKYALMSRSTQAEIFKRGTGATVVGIKASLLKQVPVSFPAAVADQKTLANAMELNASAVALLE